MSWSTATSTTIITASSSVLPGLVRYYHHDNRSYFGYIESHAGHHTDVVVDRHIDYYYYTASSTDLPGLVRQYHHDIRSHFGPIESETRHPDMVADCHHPNRPTHIEPKLRGRYNLDVGMAHHRQPHGLADSIADDIGPDRVTDNVAARLGLEPEPELGSHHLPDNLPPFGPVESGTHCHLDLISNHRHPNRLAHLEPELRGPDSLADSAAHHRRPHGLADGLAYRVGPDRLATGC